MSAAELGRDIYRRISTYVKLQLTVLSSVPQLMLIATILDVNEGIALFPLMLLFCKFFVVVTVVVGLIANGPDHAVMQMGPRPPGTRIVNGTQVVRWLVSGFLVAACALAALAWGPDKPSTTVAPVSMTMAFGIVALSAINFGLVMRRERQVPWVRPQFPFFSWMILGWVGTWAAIELGPLQRLLRTESLTGRQWGVVLAMSLVAPLVVAVDRLIQLRHTPRPGATAGAMR